MKSQQTLILCENHQIRCLRDYHPRKFGEMNRVNYVRLELVIRRKYAILKSKEVRDKLVVLVIQHLVIHGIPILFWTQ